MALVASLAHSTFEVTMRVNELFTWCQKRKFSMSKDEKDGNVWVYDTKGNLLRGFDVKEAQIDDKDFNNWKIKMGYEFEY